MTTIGEILGRMEEEANLQNPGYTYGWKEWYIPTEPKQQTYYFRGDPILDALINDCRENNEFAAIAIAKDGATVLINSEVGGIADSTLLEQFGISGVSPSTLNGYYIINISKKKISHAIKIINTLKKDMHRRIKDLRKAKRKARNKNEVKVITFKL